jgi:outer membrane cobalamin receptor
LFVLLFLPRSSSLHAGVQTEGSGPTAFEGSDSTRHISAEKIPYPLQEILVTATRQSTAADLAPSAVSVLPQSLIERKAGGSLGSALEGVPGLFVRAYGGDGAIQTVSLRGASSEQTLVLMDGMRFNSFQNGQTDFSILSKSNIERVEIVKGGLSAMYGADAIGGVINIITKKAKAKLSGAVNTSIGSNGLFGHEISLSGTEAAVGWRGSFRRERGRGDYEFEYDGEGKTVTLRRNGADFNIITSDAAVDYAMTEDMAARLSLSFSDANRGSPGVVASAGAAGLARLADKIGRSQLNLEWKATPMLIANLNSSYSYSKETYRDPQLVINGNPSQSDHTNKAICISPEIHLSMPGFTAVVGSELAHGWLVSSEVANANRWQQSVFMATQHSVSLPYEAPFEMIIYPSVRYDRFSDVNGDVSPKLGLNIGLLREPQVRLRASYGKSFRAPTFNELHWNPGGNPNLGPERSLSFDAGVVSTLKVLGSLTIDASYFSTETRDRIVWSPGSAGIWAPKNIADVESEGIEAEGRWIGFDGDVSFILNSTWNDVRKWSEDYPGDPTKGKFVVYMPRQTVSASLTLQANPLSVYIQHSWVSFRYTTGLNDRMLPSYGVTNASVNYSLLIKRVKAFVKMEATNLFDKSYEIMPLYPMPLREFRTTIGVEL